MIREGREWGYRMWRKREKGTYGGYKKRDQKGKRKKIEGVRGRDGGKERDEVKKTKGK